MRIEIKSELTRILSERFRESSQDSDRTESTGMAFSRLYDVFQDQIHYTVKYKDLLKSANDYLTAFKKISSYIEMTRKSWRYRIGNTIPDFALYLLRRKRGSTAIDKISEISKSLGAGIMEFEKFHDEPAHYLNPLYWIGKREFRDKPVRSDGSVTVIILNLNGEKRLSALFESFLKYNTYKNFSYIIVDHKSDDKSVEMINHLSTKIPIKLILLDKNLTYSYSNNYAAERADGEFLLFLNNDIIFTEDILGKYVETFRLYPDIGILGATLCFPGENQGEKVKIQHSGIIFKPENINAPGSLRPVNSEIAPEDDIAEFPAVTGAAMMIRRADYTALNGFDENYIWGYEDVDLCLSCTKFLKKKVAVAKMISMIHDEGSTRKSGSVFNDHIRQHNLDVLHKKHGKFLRGILRETGQIGPGREISVADKTEPTRVAIKISVTSAYHSRNWGDTHFAESLGKALERLGYRVRIDNSDNWYTHGLLEDDVAIAIRGLKRYYPIPGQVNIMWNISHPENISSGEFQDFDHILTASPACAKKLKPELTVPVSVLLQCTDSNMFYPVPSHDFPGNKYLFIGNSRGQFRESVSYCIKNALPLNVYGMDWEQIIPNKYIKGKYIPLDQLGLFYSNCRILLNDHWKDMSENGFISNRLFDGTACGAIILSDFVEGIAELFGPTVKQYHSEQEFIELCNEIELNYDSLKEMALKKSEEIRNNHSFDARAVEIQKIIGQLTV